MSLKHFISISLFFVFLFVCLYVVSADLLENHRSADPLAPKHKITVSINDEIHAFPVTYRFLGNDVTATIFTPENVDKMQHYPTIVIVQLSHQNALSLETLYARRFAERGYITIITTNKTAIQTKSTSSESSQNMAALKSLDINRSEDIRAMASIIREYLGEDHNSIGVLRIRPISDRNINTYSATILPYLSTHTTHNKTIHVTTSTENIEDSAASQHLDKTMNKLTLFFSENLL
ncbi:alpha/beta hydrolase family protein [Marinomonas profundimaris]|uniref:Uncharacterized protein n=1 Tax=Marinomonas profundimaris TaxID=1208321 RepID=W1RU03_9GAMM|nr:hypothetical protein [Marinomonas profundimaris]ETI60492.1 hypothetical protein D104_09145 [Marinomonas profundimaris]